MYIGLYKLQGNPLEKGRLSTNSFLPKDDVHAILTMLSRVLPMPAGAAAPADGPRQAVAPELEPVVTPDLEMQPPSVQEASTTS